MTNYKFKVGDRVKTTRTWPGQAEPPVKGSVGTVVEVGQYKDWPYQVEFDAYPRSKQHAWLFKEDELAFAPPMPKPVIIEGDRVIVKKSGAIGKVLEVRRIDPIPNAMVTKMGGTWKEAHPYPLDELELFVEQPEPHFEVGDRVKTVYGLEGTIAKYIEGASFPYAVAIPESTMHYHYSEAELVGLPPLPSLPDVDPMDLVYLIEEATEVAQAAAKCLRFGWGDDYSGKPNSEALAAEIGDFMAVVNRLNIPQDMLLSAMDAKTEKLKKYGVEKFGRGMLS